jgi:hypothetical protein
MNKIFHSERLKLTIYVYNVDNTPDITVAPDYCFVYFNTIEDYGSEPRKWYTYKSWNKAFKEIEISPVIAAFYGIEDLCHK